MSQDNNRKMKDSGIPWMPSIPDTWEVQRGKNILVLNKRPVRESDEVVTCFRDGEVILRSERRTDGFTMSDKEIGYQGINKGDIVIHGMDGFAGSMGVSKSTGKGSPVLVVCSPKYDAAPQFIIYYLRTLAMTNVFVALSTGIRERSCDLRWNKIAELQFALPPAIEQQRIADFLDCKCAEIDELAALQETMIAELKRYKQSVITEAVTKGLDPDVPMKDSGVEWIGEIPEGWEVIKCGRIFKENVRTPQEGDISLSLSQADGLIPTSLMREKAMLTSTYDGWKRVLVNDLVLNRFKAHLGVLFASKYVGMVSFHYGVYEALVELTPKYFEYLFHSHQYKLILAGASNGMVVGLQNLSNSNFYKVYCLFPPLTEQRAIADYLDQKCAEIDELIAIKQQKIESLKEYKKSVIFEYVTGKKEI